MPSDRARAFKATLRRRGRYDARASRLDGATTLRCVRSAQRGAVAMLRDADADPNPHLFAWASPGISLAVDDVPETHLAVLNHANAAFVSRLISRAAD